MRRFSAGVAAIAFIAIGVTWTASPASAHTEVCVGAGRGYTNPVYHPTLGPSASGSVVFHFFVGGCLASGATTINGTFIDNPLGNYCGYSNGQVYIGGDFVSWVGVGSEWVFLGSHGGGGLRVHADATTGQSCVAGATGFIFSGSISLR